MNKDFIEDSGACCISTRELSVMRQTGMHTRTYKEVGYLALIQCSDRMP